MNDLEKSKIIIRRKAKRIERAFDRLSCIEQDIRLFETIPEDEKKYLLNQIELLKPYLKNDDYEENQYNSDT